MAGTPLLGTYIQADNGTAAAPSICFRNSPLDGLFLKSVGTIGMTINGTEVASWNSTGPIVVGDIELSDGTVALPALSFASDPTTGIFYNGSNGLKIGTNATLALTINSAQAAAFAGALTTVGNVGLSGAVSSSAIGNLGATNPLTGVTQLCALASMTSTSAATTETTAFKTAITTAAAAYTTALRSGFRHTDVAKGSGSTITRDVAFLSAVPTQGTSNAILADNVTFTGSSGINFSGANSAILGPSGTTTNVGIGFSASAGGHDTGFISDGSNGLQIITNQTIAVTFNSSANASFAGALAVVGAPSYTRTNVASTATIASLSSASGYVKLTGSTATDLQGIAAGVSGQMLVVTNLTGQTLTIRNQSGSAASGAKIRTMTGADVTTTGNGAAGFIYDTDASPAEWTNIWNTA